MILLLLLFSMTKLFVVQIMGYPFPLIWLYVLLYWRMREHANMFSSKIKINRVYFVVGVLFLGLYVISYSNSRFSSLLMTLVWFFMGRVLIDLFEKFDLLLVVKSYKFVLILYLIISISVWLQVYLGFSLGWMETFAAQHPITGIIRPQGFATEPSYAALVTFFSLVVILFYYNGDLKKSLPYLILGCGLCAIYQSVYGYLYIGLILMFFAKMYLHNYTAVRSVFVALVFLTIMIGYVSLGDTGRLGRILSQVDWGGAGWLNSFDLADGSGFLRIAPTAKIIEEFDWSKSEAWLGHGAGAARAFFFQAFENRIDPSLGKTGFDLGFFPAFLYDYGLVGVGLVFLLVYRSFCQSIPFFVFVGVCLSLFNMNINTQAFWFMLISLMCLSKIKILHDQNACL